MEEMHLAPFLTQTLSVLSLLTISSFTYLFSKKVNFPYTVLLVFVGLLLIPISKIPLFGFIDDFTLTPDILFFVFLPVLLFESAYNINYRQLILNWKSISALAIFGLLISASLVSVGLYFLFPIIPYFGVEVPFLICLLFGVLISATDPVAVLSIFKKLGAPRRLTIIFEGESLFNDGTAVALFFVVLAIITSGGVFTPEAAFIGFWKFFSMVFGGIMFGLFMGVAFSKVIGLIKNSEEVETVLTMLLAHITFISSEIITHFFPMFPISGVISTVVASIVIGNYGRYKITPRVEVHMEKFWELFAFISNSIVFILMGLILSRIEVNFSVFIVPVIISIIVVMIARVISVYIPLGIINIFKLEHPIEKDRLKLLSWGSLRGALALMMVLLIPDLSTFEQSVGWEQDYSLNDFLLMITIGCIMFTLFVKATSTGFFMKLLGVDKLHSLEEFEYLEGKIVTNLRILQKISLLHQKAYLTEIEHEELKDKYTLKLKAAADEMRTILSERGKDAKLLIRKALSLHALGIEKQQLKELFFYNEIDERNFKYILRKIEKQFERLEHSNIRFKDISNKHIDYDIFTKILNYYFRKSSTRLDSYIRNRSRLIITRKVIKELRELQKIDFGFGKDIFEELIELYADFNKKADEKRIKIFTTHKATINAIESRLVNKSLLKLEEKTVKDLYHKEIITPKLYVRFMEEIEKEMFSDVKRFM